ncbi:MAG TPA: GDSL-type esterase/lipase family protein [Steroidobacteraceae bacterium]|jgi:lysophospholipase L1-like esterase|nr:GDSL-type esterase/lipase family protein [Steroidobacteraceae bacterium]
MKTKPPRTAALAAAFVGLALASAAAPGGPRLTPVSTPPGTKSLSAHIAGRITQVGSYQWPGLYFEAKFEGRSVYFKTGQGDVILHVLVDGESVGTLVKPVPGSYLIDGLTNGAHSVRIDAVTESQSAPNTFGGFALPAAGKALSTAPRKRQIEFIGDSHTVGYGNSSRSRDCSQDEVWATTDNSRSFAPKVALHFDADYQVNAISGRGIVRNYDGSAGDPLPVAYPFVLLNHATHFDGADWQPRIIVIALGTNDFSTALKSGEKWKTREELHADYEATYVKFIESLRARNRHAFILLWATDMAEHEIEQEAGKVVAQLQSKGDDQVAFIPIDGLAMTGCHWHPSLADHDTIAERLIRFIDDRQLAKP